jgi:hypothetical protein
LGMLIFEFIRLSSFSFFTVVPVAASMKTKLGRGGGDE